jgi:hypothetical protein
VTVPAERIDQRGMKRVIGIDGRRRERHDPVDFIIGVR